MRSASGALCGFIDGEIGCKTTPSRMPGRLLAGAQIAAAVGAIALPSLAHPSLRADFDRPDTDHDGRITFDEFQAAKR